jgi:hypothetical protein
MSGQKAVEAVEPPLTAVIHSQCNALFFFFLFFALLITVKIINFVLRSQVLPLGLK